MEILVIMGAAVLPDGMPSGALRRRVEGALALASHARNPYYVVTGGRGRFGPPESDVMKNMLRAAGVAEDRIETDDRSVDTLSSIFRCTQIVKARDPVEAVIVCSDRYHIPRCRWLFWLLGVPTKYGLMPSGQTANGLLRWLYYYIRETLALPVDTLLVLFRRLAYRDSS